MGKKTPVANINVFNEALDILKNVAGFAIKIQFIIIFLFSGPVKRNLKYAGGCGRSRNDARGYHFLFGSVWTKFWLVKTIANMNTKNFLVYFVLLKRLSKNLY